MVSIDRSCNSGVACEGDPGTVSLKSRNGWAACCYQRVPLSISFILSLLFVVVVRREDEICWHMLSVKVA